MRNSPEASFHANHRTKRLGWIQLVPLLLVAFLFALHLKEEFSVTFSTISQTRPREDTYAAIGSRASQKEGPVKVSHIRSSPTTNSTNDNNHTKNYTGILGNNTGDGVYPQPNAATVNDQDEISITANHTNPYYLGTGNWTDEVQESWNSTKPIISDRTSANSTNPTDLSANVTEDAGILGSFTNLSTWNSTSTIKVPGELNEGASNRTTDFSPFNISIVLQLSGEMGNHLSKFALAHVVKERLWRDHGIASHLVLQHQERAGGKWKTAKEDMVRCFPHLRNLDYSAGNSEVFERAMRRQRMWLDSRNAKDSPMPLIIPFDRSPLSTLSGALSYLENLLRYNVSSIPKEFEYRKAEDTANITVPFIYLQDFVDWGEIDQHYSTLKQYFKFDKEACCAGLPHEDENIFHFRNFVGEMPRVGVKKGFEELNPNRTASELFGHLATGEKIAIITSRRGKVENDSTQLYVDAFSSRGLTVRLIENQSGPEDFCFLQNGKRSVGGMAKSTFFLWASLLGTASNVRMYSIDSNSTRKAVGMNAVIDYEWQDQELRERVAFVSFKQSR